MTGTHPAWWLVAWVVPLQLMFPTEQPFGCCILACVRCAQAVRSLRESVDLSRLSRIALSNLEKDDGVTDYTAAQPASAGGDITIDSTDAELDFEEVADQGESVCARHWQTLNPDVCERHRDGVGWRGHHHRQHLCGADLRGGGGPGSERVHALHP